MSLTETNGQQPRRVLITGTAGFIGFHLAQLLLAEGFQVHGYDGMSDYYDVNLKRRRHQMLLQHPGFQATEGLLEDEEKLWGVAESFQPQVIVHLAAQAGVRFSLENPRAYIDSNIIGTFNVMEAARKLGVEHLLMASTSSVYGANEKMPFTELEKADTQLTIPEEAGPPHFCVGRSAFMSAAQAVLVFRVIGVNFAIALLHCGGEY